ncbi:LuxR C-terminal-related transcriptional regulator [Streptomyces sp. NPDC055109]
MGRDRELQEFRSSISHSNSADFPLTVIWGNRGVGKSHLATHFLKVATDFGFAGYHITATRDTREIPFGAISHFLAQDLRHSNPASAFSALLRRFQQRTTRKVALLVDDLHFLDPASAVTLRQLIDSSTACLIFTALSDAEPAAGAIRALTGDSSVNHINLTELDLESTQILASLLLNRIVTHGATRELHALSGGNPLYLKEIATNLATERSCTQDDEIHKPPYSETDFSPRLNEIIKNRISQVSPGGMQILTLLAICGPLGLTDVISESSEEEVLKLEESGLIKLRSELRRTTVSLQIPTAAAFIRNSMDAERRQDILIRQIGRYKEYGALRRIDHAQIATWTVTASGSAHPALLAKAGKIASDLRDYKRATSFLTAIPKIHRELPDTLTLGDSLMCLGEAKEAELILAQAGNLAINEKDKVSITFRRILNHSWGTRGGDPVKVSSLLREARSLASCPAGESPLRIMQASGSLAQGEIRNCLNLLEDAGENYLDTSLSAVTFHGLSIKSLALTVNGRPTKSLPLASATLSAYVDLPKAEIAVANYPFGGLNCKILALTESGEMRKVRDLGTRAIKDAVSIDASMMLGWTALFLARAELIAGHPVSAQQWYAEAAALSSEFPDSLMLDYVWSGTQACSALLGREVNLTRCDERGSGDAAGSIGLLAGEEVLGHAWGLVASNRVSDARALLRIAATRAAEAGNFASSALLLTDLARLGESQAAANIMKSFISACEGNLVKARFSFVEAAAANDPDLLFSAALQLENSGVDLVAAEAVASAAGIWARSGEKRRSGNAANFAAELVGRCEGASTPGVREITGSAQLTAREYQIARIVAEGGSSKEIATHLTLSVRTIDNHLQRVYEKLGIRSRAELSRFFLVNSQP